MLSLKYYKTITHDKWLFVMRKRNGVYTWQRVKRFLCFYIPKGKPFRDSMDMFYRI